MKEVKLPRKTKGTSMRWKGGEEHEGEYAERTSQQTYTNTLKINAFKERFEAGEMVKCFLCKHEDLSSKPDTYKKKLSLVPAACNSSARRQRQREPRSFLTSQSGLSLSSSFCEGPCLRKQGEV